VGSQGERRQRPALTARPLPARLPLARLPLATSHGTLAELFSGRNNSIGLLRLVMAVSVVISHSRPLGFGREDVGHYLFRSQTNLGNLAVYGFFVLSGLLITRSARRTSITRYIWHRMLRILPGLWVCLIISSFVVAPLIMLREHGDLNGFWAGPDGPLQYVSQGWWTGLRQLGIHDLFRSTTPWGRRVHTSVFNGALWSLAYEILCYVGIGALAVLGMLRRARGAVLAATVAALGVIWYDSWFAGHPSGPVVTVPRVVHAPLVGEVNLRWLVYLGFLFLIGALFDLYAERVPVNDLLGIASAVAFVSTLLFGGFYVLGFPAYAYLLVWLGVRLPRQVHWIGQRNDYSYGIYIYGFLCQQILASFGENRWGFLPFAAISLVAAGLAGFLSWHLVEKHAMALKNWTPRVGWRACSRDSSSGGAPDGGPRQRVRRSPAAR
jgi:peptidoglycan/LPS O-acetylase OafA/YrhL